MADLTLETANRATRRFFENHPGIAAKLLEGGITLAQINIALADRAPVRLLSFKDLKPGKGIHFSRVHLWRLVACGQFPKPIQLSANRIAWEESAIDAWIEERNARPQVEGK